MALVPPKPKELRRMRGEICPATKSPGTVAFLQKGGPFGGGRGGGEREGRGAVRQGWGARKLCFFIMRV